MKTTNEKIVTAALSLFGTKGYSGTSMRDLADELGVVPGAIYKHYPSKHDVYQAIVREMEKHEERFWERSAPREGASVSLEDVDCFVRDMIHFWTGEQFPAAFRRLLTSQQYGSTEMTKTYQHYFGDGPVEYLNRLLIRAGVSSPENTALRLWSLSLLLMTVHDSPTAPGRIMSRLDRLIGETIRRA